MNKGESRPQSSTANAAAVPVPVVVSLRTRTGYDLVYELSSH